jgi:hypothetical protein
MTSDRNPQVEAAANRYVDHVVARYGAKGALSRTRLVRHEYRRDRQPKWLTRAIEILEARQ